MEKNKGLKSILHFIDKVLCNPFLECGGVARVGHDFSGTPMYHKLEIQSPYQAKPPNKKGKQNANTMYVLTKQ